MFLAASIVKYYKAQMPLKIHEKNNQQETVQTRLIEL